MARPADPTSWTRKAVNDFVTGVDREAERLVAETLRQGEPGSVVMGEEMSPTQAAAPLLWVVDPLDGTTNYLHAYPQYAVSVGALADGVLVAGAVADIARGLTYTASLGGGAWCGEERLRVSTIHEPMPSLIGTGFPFRAPPMVPRYLRQFTAIMQATSGIRRAGAAALDLVDVAAGRLDGFWELDLAPWDIAAGTLMIREAGGVVTDAQGQQEVVRHTAIVAGNAAIHAWLLDVVSRDS